MNNFYAKKAREITNSVYNSAEVNEVLRFIESAARKGSCRISIYDRLNDSTLKEIESRGFEVFRHSLINIHRDDLYYTISW